MRKGGGGGAVRGLQAMGQPLPGNQNHLQTHQPPGPALLPHPYMAATPNATPLFIPCTGNTTKTHRHMALTCNAKEKLSTRTWANAVRSNFSASCKGDKADADACISQSQRVRDSLWQDSHNRSC